MLTLYKNNRDKHIGKMSLDELVSFYHIPKPISKKMVRGDIIAYIRQNTLLIGYYPFYSIQPICIKYRSNTIYTEIIHEVYEPSKILFEKIHDDECEYYAYTKKEKLWLRYNGSWWAKDVGAYYKKQSGSVVELFNYLRKIVIFLEVRELYFKLCYLHHHLIKDIIKYIGFKLINHDQLYFIIK